MNKLYHILVILLFVIYSVFLFAAGYLYHGSQVNASIDYGHTLRQFYDVEEMSIWLSQRPPMLIPSGINLNEACSYVAEEYQRQAISDGFLMSTQIVDREKLKKGESMGNHEGLMTRLGEVAVYIEPFNKSFMYVGKRPARK